MKVKEQKQIIDEHVGVALRYYATAYNAAVGAPLPKDRAADFAAHILDYYLQKVPQMGFMNVMEEK